MGGQSAVVAPITKADVPEVAAYLHRALNPRLSEREWGASIQPPWQVDAPNHGFHLRSRGQVVGAAIAFYADRTVRGRTERVCNLAAWCVDEEHRSQGLRLVRALLSQRDYHFTDLSPSGNVVALNERLKFEHLDTTTVLAPHLPRPRAASVAVSDPARIAVLLSGDQRRIFDDHRHAAAARHVVVTTESQHVYVMFRKDRRKHLPVFASLLHVSHPDQFPRVWNALSAHMLLHHGAVATLLEQRMVGWRPPGAVTLARSRPRMFRSDRLDARDIDYLYSELTCVAW